MIISITNKGQACFGAYVLLCSEVRAFDRLTGSLVRFNCENNCLTDV